MTFFFIESYRIVDKNGLINHIYQTKPYRRSINRFLYIDRFDKGHLSVWLADKKRVTTLLLGVLARGGRGSEIPKVVWRNV